MPWEVWRVWISKRATLQELETHWSLLDVAMANDALDLDEDMKAKAQERG